MVNSFFHKGQVSTERGQHQICEAAPNALVNGIRIRLAGGGLLVVADDPEEDEPGFLTVLEQACRGAIAEVAYSRHLRELERKKLI
jgi:hypothetical protein